LIVKHWERTMLTRACIHAAVVFGMILVLTFTSGIFAVEAVEGHAPSQMVVADFFDRLCDGEWYGGYEGAPYPEWPKRLPCPGLAGDSNGFVSRLSSSDTLENGQDGSHTVESYPTMVTNGFIRGTWALNQLGVTLQSGDRFLTQVGFVDGMTEARARFMVIYDPDPVESGDERQLADITKDYNGKLQTIDVDLSQYAGQGGNLILRVETVGPPSQDRAVWVDPRIERAPPPTSPIPPTKTLTRTPTPTTYTPITDTPFPTETQHPTLTPTPTGQILPGCVGAVRLSQDPLIPAADQQVTFVASMDELCDLERVDLWVNNENVHSCSKLPCKYVGGPYPEGVHIFSVVAEDINGNFLPSENVIVDGSEVDTTVDYVDLEIDLCPLCPERPDLGPCIQQTCYGPSQPDITVQEQNYIGCLYQGQDLSQPWTLLDGGSTDGWYTDTCISATVLAEYFCQGTAGLRELHYDCEICHDGICDLCEDSDGGVNPFVPGITAQGVQDACLTDSAGNPTARLREYFNTYENGICLRQFVDIHCPSGCNAALGACNATCTDGIQNGDEEGIDCGGSCPASCMSCWGADWGGGPTENKFSLTSSDVHMAASEAILEYVNCLRNYDCRMDLHYKPAYLVFGKSYDQLTAWDIMSNTDFIMEAVAYYVDKHMTYMLDGGLIVMWECDENNKCNFSFEYASEHPGVQSAAWTITESGNRLGAHDGPGYYVFDYCPTRFCGDCEDHAILREALLRVLGISAECAYCADYYESYEGGGHTFNLVLYRGKWRIMDYGQLGSYFRNHNPKLHTMTQHLFNDTTGIYWCPDWKDALGDGHYDEGCSRNHPKHWTWNYVGGDHCPSSYDIETYYTLNCP
jgi:hypothetical protein